MRRYQPTSEEVWAKAIHSVTEQKRSLRQAAQLHGVHHMSLHRRVRGLSGGGSLSTPPSPSGSTGSSRGRARGTSGPAAGADLVRHFLTEADEREVLGVLREQFHHEQRITSDDVRFVVRAVASHGGKRAIPPDFPPSRWILDFKRLHGFVKFSSFAYGSTVAAPTSSAAFGLPERLDVGDLSRGSRSNSIARVTASSNSSSEGEKDTPENARYPSGNNVRYPSGNNVRSLPRYTMPSSAYEDQQQLQYQQQQYQQQQRRSMVVDDRRGVSTWQQDRSQPADREELGSNTSSGSFDSENGTTTGASSSNSNSSSGDLPSGNIVTNSSSNGTHTTTNAASNSTYYEPQDNAATASEKRGYKLSHTVPPETWEKAIAAVEQQGMSLRAAAKIYGVHFAALHRRVKKRAQGGQSAKANSGYFHPSDEAGIMRVVVARAELGVLMTFDELMKLVEMAALRKLPDLSVDNARRLMARFQTRNEQSIRHIIVDWPPPRPAGNGENGSQPQLYHMEHPGYDYGASEPPPDVRRAFMPRSSADSGGLSTAAAVAAAAPSLFEPPTRVGPPIPSSSGALGAGSNGLANSAPPAMTTSTSKPLGALPPPPPPRVASAAGRTTREQESGPSHPVMYV